MKAARNEKQFSASSQNADMFRRFDQEIFLADRLREHGIKPFDGDTSTLSRKEHLRAWLLQAGCWTVIVGRAADDPRKTETYAQAFERVYGEPLEPKPQRKGK